MPEQKITVIGAGITGLLQCLTLAREGYAVTLLEKNNEPFAEAASRIAGAMLAPFCESEIREELVLELGPQSIELWQKIYPQTQRNGTLVVALPRDLAELTRFAKATVGGQKIDQKHIETLEPDLADRFKTALFYPDEGHIQPSIVMNWLLETLYKIGVDIQFGAEADMSAIDGIVIDCTGMAAQGALKQLRGLRGEMMVIKTHEVSLNRPVRLLHPRFPLYIVPWADGHFMIGATMIESEDQSNVRVRSALELLSTAYSLHPAFGEAEIISMRAACRPCYPDNLPRITVRGQKILVNGMHRNGFLLAPILAKQVAQYIQTGEIYPETFKIE